MSLPTPADVRDCLPAGVRSLVVAFSGGLDSSVLLELAYRSGLPVRAVHVHHGLSPVADDWVLHCQQVCGARDIELAVVRITVEARGEGLQAAARAARYQALGAQVAPTEALLTAHHADDQAETLLLRLLRGTGVDGLAGIPVSARFGAGWLVRPLLQYRRADLRPFAEASNLDWVEDPANAALRFDRVRVRQSVVPVLEAAWPGAVAALNHLASDARADRELRERLLAPRLAAASVRENGPLRVSALTDEPSVVQLAMLRSWLRAGGQRPPGRRRLVAGCRALLGAAADRAPALEWPEGRVARYAGWLYRLPVTWPGLMVHRSVAASTVCEWAGLGVLRWLSVGGPRGLPTARVEDGLRARAAEPGDALQLPGRPRKALKSLFREAGVPPWWRARVPVLVDERNQPLAVPGLGVDARAGAAAGTPGLRPIWQPTAQMDAPDWVEWIRRDDGTTIDPDTVPGAE